MYEAKTCSINRTRVKRTFVDSFRYVCSKPDPKLCLIGNSLKGTNPLRAVTWASDPNDGHERPGTYGLQSIAQVRCVYDLDQINTFTQVENLYSKLEHRDLGRLNVQTKNSMLFKLLCKKKLYGTENQFLYGHPEYFEIVKLDIFCQPEDRGNRVQAIYDINLINETYEPILEPNPEDMIFLF
jgi:hypothetical protein